MPVRKIPKNYLVVTGSFASRKNGRMLGFESLLERDYMILLDFDDDVERFEEQPVQIPFRKGVKPYVPDLLIHYDQSRQDRRPVLAEVKHTSDLTKHQDKYAPKFEQAEHYAKNRQWDFRVVTEQESRPARLKALKFLREYLHVEPDPGDVARVIATLGAADGEMPLNELLDNLCTTDTERLLLVPTVWHLVATRRVAIDYDQPIHDKTLLSLP
jgi:hypothetical protein